MEVELKIFLTRQEPTANHFYKKPQNNTSPDVPLISQGLIWELIIHFNRLTTEQKGTRLWTSAFNCIVDPSLFLLLRTKIIFNMLFFWSPRMNLTVCSATSEQAITVASLAESLHLLMSASRKTDNKKENVTMKWTVRKKVDSMLFSFSPHYTPHC